MASTEILNFANLLASEGIADLSTEIVNEFWEIAQQFGLTQVQAAMQTHHKDPDKGCYPLKPVDLRRILTGGGVMQALQAWTKVRKAMTEIGSYTSVVFDDALIHAVIADMGGWVNLCACDRRELGFSAREFQQRYQRFLQQIPSHYPSRLCGRMGRDSLGIGDKGHALAFIGEPDKARAVMAAGDSRSSPKRRSISALTKTLARQEPPCPMVAEQGG